ncbi:conjugative transfer ATPase [Vibrio cholerae]|uniref:Conjugative transfer ATPase n=1 Tax=Vibrio cholerae TaxID=666 RepID=A0A7Z7YEH9_VIBCL|nr:conjugative transfer ATPase [Vibrio cholerae]EGR5063506.1 conjugative transfer ATPase [Vibrio cholerae]TBM41302.1 conjugative transfer ATPase [Vibrio cholerae]HAS5424113.1 conjugative transfer ATPase [Vibrio cholerae]
MGIKLREMAHKAFRLATQPSQPKVKRHTIADRSQLYRETKSFSDFLPYSEWLEEEEMILLDDLVSVGTVWEVQMAPSEARSQADLDAVEESLYEALDAVTLQYLSDGQYVLSTYLRDDFDLNDEFEDIKNSVHPAWQGTPLADEYLRSLKKMFGGLESEKGLFSEGSEGNLKPFRGCKRIPRLCLYRRVSLKERTGLAKLRAREISELSGIRAQLEDAFSTAGVKLTRATRESFHSFMVRWFNPFPEMYNGSVNELLKHNPCPPAELSALEGEYAMSFLFNTPKTDSEKGTIEFDGCPSRFLQVDRLSKVPTTGLLTSEMSINGGADFTSNFDLLPSGTMFVKHIFFQTEEEANARIDYIDNKSQFNDDKARRVNNEARKTKETIAAGGKLFKTEMGFYVTAFNDQILDSKCRKISALASQRLGLGVITPKDNLFPVESYLRNLPLVMDPVLDIRRRRGRLNWLNLSVSLMPFIGRKRGNDDPKNKRCMTLFNRGGEIINIDPVNKESNAHMVLLGPTGTGKSATLNKAIIELLIFHNARLVIAEAGMSFDPLMDFLEAQNADIQRININAGSIGRPIAPFANARKARERVIRERSNNGQTEQQVIEYCISSLAKEESDFNNSDNAIVDRVRAILSEAEDKSAEIEKDYLGECVMIAKIMVTGGDPKEEQAFRLRDTKHLASAILSAVGIADLEHEEQVRPEHVVKALRARADDESAKLDDATRSRLLEMADCMDRYCEPGTVHNDIVNRPAEPFKKCDCLHVELGIAQRDGYEDVLALAYLSLLNNVNDIAERKTLEGDDRPIYVITDEAHLILKHRMIAPVAIKIVRMWRKYGCWFLPATQDTSSFTNGAEAILVIGEMFIALSPPPDEVDALTKLLSLNEEQQQMLATCKMAKFKYTEGVYMNRQRKSTTLFRVLQPSFTLSLAGTDDAEKQSRHRVMREYNIRMAGAVVIEAANLDYRRGIITKDELESEINMIAKDPRYKLVV